MSLRAQISEDMKSAMRAKETERLATIRLLQAAIKQREVDERIELQDVDVIAVIEKMLKQRRDSIEAYDKAGRDDLSAVEKAEVVILQTYLPEQLSDDEITAMLDKVIMDTGAASMKDMGKVMGMLKPMVAGKADIGKISALIKAKLA